MTAENNGPIQRFVQHAMPIVMAIVGWGAIKVLEFEIRITRIETNDQRIEELIDMRIELERLKKEVPE